MSSAFYDLRVKDIIDETDDAKSFVLEVPERLAELFHYESGQFLTVRVVVAGKELQRCYSLSSVHPLDPDLKFTTKRVPYGPVSNWLLDTVTRGDRLQVMRAAGIFINRNLGQDLALYAAGSGITPLISLARSTLQKSISAEVFLFYANRNEKSVIFRAELQALSAQYAERLHITHWLESVQGVPHENDIVAVSRGVAERESFVCGPAPFMEAVESALLRLGVDHHRIKLEKFTFTPIREAAPQQGITGTELGVATRLEVTLDGETRVIECRPGELMLDAIERAGLKPPYSCRSGSCGACICTLLSGEATMRVNDLLDDRDIAEGMLLSCQAIARSPTITIKY